MNQDNSLSRRKYLQIAGVVGTAGLAGCSTGQNDAPTDTPEGDTTPGSEPTRTDANQQETTENPGNETESNSGLVNTPAFSFQVNNQNHGMFEQLVPTDVSISWYETGINLSLHDAAKASPVPTPNGNLIVPGDTGEVTSFTRDGEANWASTTHPSSRGIHATPVIANGTAYVGAYDGAMYAFNIETGALEWRTQLGDAIGGSAAYKDGALYVPVEFDSPSGALYKLNASDGSIQTGKERPSDHPHSTPGIDAENNLIAFGSNDAGLYVYSLPDLEFQYRFATGGAIKSPIGVFDGHAVFGSWDGNIYCLDLADGSTRWVEQTDSKIMCAPAIDTETNLLAIGGHDGTMRGLTLESGEERWQVSTNGSIYGSAVVCEDAVLFGNAAGRLYAVSKSVGEQKWTQEFSGHVTSAPLLQGGRVYVTTRRSRSTGRLYCLE